MTDQANRSLSQLSALGGKVMSELKDTAENTEHLKGVAFGGTPEEDSCNMW